MAALGDGPLLPWKGEVVHSDRRIIFHKATKPSTRFASGVAPTGLKRLEFDDAAPLRPFPAVPDRLLSFLGWNTITRVGTGLVNTGQSSWLNTVLQVCDTISPGVCCVL